MVLNEAAAKGISASAIASGLSGVTLDRAYAFVASDNFQTVAEKLKDGLVEGAGFDRLEVEQLVKQHGVFEFDDERADFIHTSDALPDAANATLEDVIAAIDKLPSPLRRECNSTRRHEKLG